MSSINPFGGGGAGSKKKKPKASFRPAAGGGARKRTPAAAALGGGGAKARKRPAVPPAAAAKAAPSGGAPRGGRAAPQAATSSPPRRKDPPPPEPTTTSGTEQERQQQPPSVSDEQIDNAGAAADAVSTEAAEQEAPPAAPDGGLPTKLTAADGAETRQKESPVEAAERIAPGGGKAAAAASRKTAPESGDGGETTAGGDASERADGPAAVETTKAAHANDPSTTLPDSSLAASPSKRKPVPPSPPSARKRIRPGSTAAVTNNRKAAPASAIRPGGSKPSAALIRRPGGGATATIKSAGAAVKPGIAKASAVIRPGGSKAAAARSVIRPGGAKNSRPIKPGAASKAKGAGRSLIGAAKAKLGGADDGESRDRAAADDGDDAPAAGRGPLTPLFRKKGGSKGGLVRRRPVASSVTPGGAKGRRKGGAGSAITAGSTKRPPSVAARAASGRGAPAAEADGAMVSGAAAAQDGEGPAADDASVATSSALSLTEPAIPYQHLGMLDPSWGIDGAGPGENSLRSFCSKWKAPKDEGDEGGETDAQLEAGGTYGFGVAFWDPYETETSSSSAGGGWTDAGHYVSGCSREWIDLILASDDDDDDDENESKKKDDGDSDPDIHGETPHEESPPTPMCHEPLSVTCRRLVVGDDAVRPTLDGDLDDWSDIEGTTTYLAPALGAKFGGSGSGGSGTTTYPHGRATIKCSYDDSRIYFGFAIPGPYRFDRNENKKCPAVSTMLKMGKDATFVNMGGCPDAVGGCPVTSSGGVAAPAPPPPSCEDYKVDLGGHWEVKTTTMGTLYPLNIVDGTGDDPVANKDDEYAVSPHCRLDDDGPNAGNEWSGAWSHDAPVPPGVDPSRSSSLNGANGAAGGTTKTTTTSTTGSYTFEMSRLLTTSSPDTDAQLEAGGTYGFGLAFWDPYETDEGGWTESGHYVTGCGTEWMYLSLVDDTPGSETFDFDDLGDAAAPDAAADGAGDQDGGGGGNATKMSSGAGSKKGSLVLGYAYAASGGASAVVGIVAALLAVSCSLL